MIQGLHVIIYIGSMLVGRQFNLWSNAEYPDQGEAIDN